MRVLVATWPAPSHYFPTVPLLSALRLAGHEVLVAAQPTVTKAVTTSGAHAVVLGKDPEIAAPGGTDRGGGGFPFPESAPLVCRTANVTPWVKLAELNAPATIAFARSWSPDLVVYEPSCYAGRLAAHAVGVPAVRHLWGVDYTAQFRGLEPYALAGLCARLDLPPLPPHGDLIIDCCPEPMQVKDDAPRLRTRYVPYNGRAVLPAWLREPPSRPRVCVTWGTTGYSRGPYHERLRMVIESVASDPDLDVVVTLSPADAEAIGPLPDRVRPVTMLALNLLLPTCSALVSQGGQGTMMTASVLGVPHLVVPQSADQTLNARLLASTGAGLMLPLDEVTPETLAARLSALIRRPEHHEAAGALAETARRQLDPAETIPELERLASAGKPADRPGPKAKAPEHSTPALARESRSPCGSAASAGRRARLLRVLFALPRWEVGATANLVPFAWAHRLAGHEVLLAVPRERLGWARSTGLPAVPVGDAVDRVPGQRRVFELPEHAETLERNAKAGLAGLMTVRWGASAPKDERPAWADHWQQAYVRIYRDSPGLSADLVDGTVSLARDWRPDRVVFTPRDGGGALAAAVLGVPSVRHLDWTDHAALTLPFEQEAAEPLWAAYGLGEPDLVGSVTVDPCPVALRLYTDYPRLPARYVPYAPSPGPVPPLPPRRRPRVCVSIRALAAWPDEQARCAARVLGALASLDVDVLLLASERDRAELGRTPANARVFGDLPLTTMLPACDALVTAGEADALFAAIVGVVPALVLPQSADQALRSHLFGRTGGGIVLAPSAAGDEAIRSAVRELLDEPRFRTPLARMHAEIREHLSYADVVTALDDL